MGQTTPEPVPPAPEGAFDVEVFVRRTMHEVWNWRMFGKVHEYYAPDFRCHSVDNEDYHGQEDTITWYESLVAAFPDAEMFVDHVYWLGSEADGYRVSTRSAPGRNAFGLWAVRLADRTPGEHHGHQPAAHPRRPVRRGVDAVQPHRADVPTGRACGNVSDASVGLVQDFYRARFRADLEQALARLSGKPVDLLDYEEVRQKLRAVVTPLSRAQGHPDRRDRGQCRSSFRIHPRLPARSGG